MTTAAEVLGDLLARARAAGADAADAVLIAGTSLSVSRRLGKLEQLERSEARDLGLRVFVGQRSAIVSSASVDPAAFATLAERAVAMARVVPDDPYGGLAETTTQPDAEVLARLDLADGLEPDDAALIARAATAEDAALAVAGITNSEGADASYERTQVTLATSAGFAASYVRTSHSVSATALAGQGTGMQRDYDYSSATHLADLEDAAGIGASAAHRALARLNPQRPATARLPVVYDPRVSGSILRHLSAAINGASVVRGTSFLAGRLGSRIMASGIHVIDDPRRTRGPRSRPFDGEGVATATRALVEDGVLRSWLLDSRSARQLGLASTGHASRGTGGPPSPAASNLYLRAGSVTPAALMADVKLGLYVTELIGMGVNGLTGDYSRGASGFRIVKGAIAGPVAEFTVAGNLLAMFAALTPANDLEWHRSVNVPTIRIDGMMIAGD